MTTQIDPIVEHLTNLYWTVRNDEKEGTHDPEYKAWCIGMRFAFAAIATVVKDTIDRTTSRTDLSNSLQLLMDDAVNEDPMIR